jgi:hypothetical protein
VRAPTAVLGLRRGARSGELRRVCVQASPCSIQRFPKTNNRIDTVFCFRIDTVFCFVSMYYRMNP